MISLVLLALIFGCSLYTLKHLSPCRPWESTVQTGSEDLVNTLCSPPVVTGTVDCIQILLISLAASEQPRRPLISSKEASPSPPPTTGWRPGWCRSSWRLAVIEHWRLFLAIPGILTCRWLWVFSRSFSCVVVHGTKLSSSRLWGCRTQKMSAAARQNGEYFWQLPRWCFVKSSRLLLAL